MVKECQVILNNDAVTVAKFGEIIIQFPSIKKDADTVFVKYEDGKYTIVDKPTVFKTEKKMSTDKKTIKNKVTVTEKVGSDD